MYTLSKDMWKTETLTKLAVLGVLAFVLMLFEFPLVWLAPPFLKLDISDLPALLGSFALGPMAGVIVQLLKNLLFITIRGSASSGVGELANFIVGSVFAYTAGAIYFKKKTMNRAVLGLVSGTLMMTLIITFANYFFLFPMYARVYGLSIETLVEMGTAINSNIVDLKTMMVYAIVPFNLLKGILVSAITILVYKRLSPILHK
ncbi:MAG: ECF transporter S component [Tissierellales bacterium]|nr:ECF transporter S component [Tissierellales bacterium]